MAQPTISQPVPPAAKPAPASVPSGPVARLRYTGIAQISVRGPQSGRVYVFSGKDRERIVQKNDVDALLRVGLFRRV